MPTKKTATKKRVPVRRAPARSIEIEEDSHDSPVRNRQVPMATTVSLALYRRIALAFICIVSVTLVAVVYLSTVEATIKITPVQKQFSSDLIVHTALNPIDPTDIKGIVVTGTLNKTKTFTPTGAGAKKVEGISKGNVTITNKSSASQGLVATTRLLTKDGVLFRLDKSVNVPAGGSIVAAVHADKAGVAGDVPSSHFTIPGLNAEKQTLIFADNTEQFVGGESSVAVVSKDELDEAIKTTQEESLNDAKDMLRAQAGGTFDGESFTSDIVNQKTSIQPNTESKSYDVTLTVSVTGVFYDRVALTKLMAEHVYEGIGQGQDFSGTDMTKMTVTVDQIDAKQKIASLRAHVDGNIITTRTSKSLDASRFLGLNAQEVKDLLISDGIASSVDVHFFPFWITHVPRLKDHITILLK